MMGLNSALVLGIDLLGNTQSAWKADCVLGFGPFSFKSHVTGSFKKQVVESPNIYAQSIVNVIEET